MQTVQELHKSQGDIWLLTSTNMNGMHLSCQEKFAALGGTARRAVIADIEQHSLQETGYRSDVVTLYGGARYHLYRYKRFTDVRLVWAPEASIAFFGGDAANFEYPRYCLDVCIFRVYENDRPARIEHFLRIDAKGPAAGELVFVSGNPGRTQRLDTVAALKYERDVRLPHVMDDLRRREILLQQFSLRGNEQRWRARDDLFGVQNSRKAIGGMLLGLQDPQLMDRKSREENALLARIEADPTLRDDAQAWPDVADVVRREAERIDQVSAFSSRLYQIAETIVFLASEDQKPNRERLPEYRDSNRESLRLQLFSPAVIYPDLDQAKPTNPCSILRRRLTSSRPPTSLVGTPVAR